MTRSVFTDRYKRLCSMMRRERLKARLTQSILNAELDRPNTFVSKYELGERRLDLIEFLEIAELIGFDPHNFIDELRK